MQYNELPLPKLEVAKNVAATALNLNFFHM
jgi:hypothetical protein